ncbi:MAG: GNAT family N-acetyltransferase [Actinomycetota bacterium]
MTDFSDLPIDAQSAAALKKRGLRFARVDITAPETFEAWFQAIGRGFLGERTTSEVVSARRPVWIERRASGVWDDTAANPESPVATIGAWHTDLTVPGHTSVPAWAISVVTVSPTHRRRGIATELLTSELRTAQALGVPLAILTVSESTIYSRWGFAPSAMTADWSIDTRRLRWTGPAASGRTHFVERDQLLADGAEIIERVRLATPGQIEFHGVLWERLVGLDDDKHLRELRYVRYDDDGGVAQGFAIYVVVDHETAADRAVVKINYLATATDDAYAGLWQHFLSMDLVDEVRAPLRAIDEPVRWLISDYRAASKSLERDHLWVRIVDLPAALVGRRYHSPGHLVLDVTDDQGFATGRWLLTISSDGTAVVTPLDGDIPDDADAVALDVRELGAIYLGGVSAVTLARAGLIEELTPGAAAVVENCFHATVTPWLSIWF